MKNVFLINAQFLAIECIVLFVLLISLFTVTVASQQVLTGNDSPLRVEQHPSTFFDPTKPVFNQFETYGIHMVLPIGQALIHAKKAVAFAGAIPKRAIEYDEVMATSEFNNNSIATKTLPPSTVWYSSMVQMLHIKEESVQGKITGLMEMVKSNAVPAHDFVQAINLHHAAAQHSRQRRATTTKFVRRSIDLNLDLTSAVSAFFHGVSSIFHFRAIDEVASAVNNLQVKQIHLRQFTQSFATKVAKLLSLMNIKETEDIHTLETVMAIYMVLDESEEFLDTIIDAITPLLQGVIPSCMVTPANLVKLYNLVDSEAKKNGLSIALADATEILSLTPFTFQRGDNFEILLSVPVINPKNQFATYRLINLPAIRDGTPTVWDLPRLFFGLRQTLYPQEAEYVVIEVEEIHQLCKELFSSYLCKVPTMTKPTCVSDLYHNLSDHCKTKRPTFTAIRMPISKNHLFFFENVTDLLIKCNMEFAKIQVQGLIQIEDRSNCQVVAEHFSFTFLGENPQKIFSQAPIKVVNENMMMNISKPTEDQIQKSIKNLKAEISGFNESVEKEEPIQVPSIFNYANLSLSLVALTTSVVLMVFFVLKCRRAIIPPGQEPT